MGYGQGYSRGQLFFRHGHDNKSKILHRPWKYEPLGRTGWKFYIERD